jgi:hypothetical protein
MHRQLYARDRPQLITTVFTSCLMYAIKTEHTENIVKPIIENYASSLIIECSETDTTISMALARTQALLLYMLMREPHYVERDLPVLEKWTEHLTYIRDSSGVERTLFSPQRLKTGTRGSSGSAYHERYLRQHTS